MKYTFEDLGWYFAWDEEGKHPIDVSNPIPIPPDGSVTLYLASKPKQQSDGTWVQWFVIEGHGERIDSVRAGCLDEFTVKKTFIVAGEKTDNTYNIDNITGMAIEELFIGNTSDNQLLVDEWPNSGKKISDYSDISQGIYVKFEDFENKLGGLTNGGAWLEFSEIPVFVGGVNYQMCDLTSINASIQRIKYTQHQTVAVLCKIVKDQDRDVVLFENQILKIYWNNEDYGVYIEVKPPVGELKVEKINSNPVEIGENIYVAVTKNGAEYSVNCNGNKKSFTFYSADYLEEYVKHDDSLEITVTDNTEFYKITGNRTCWGANIWICGQARFVYTFSCATTWWSVPSFAPNKNRGSFVNGDYISKITNFDNPNLIEFPENKVIERSVYNEALNSRLYHSQKITISNITKPFYISAILNPARMTGVVKRTYYVEDNEIKYRDEVYAV